MTNSIDWNTIITILFGVIGICITTIFTLVGYFFKSAIADLRASDKDAKESDKERQRDIDNVALLSRKASDDLHLFQREQLDRFSGYLPIARYVAEKDELKSHIDKLADAINSLPEKLAERYATKEELKQAAKTIQQFLESEVRGHKKAATPSSL